MPRADAAPPRANALELARTVLRVESQAVAAMIDRLDDAFVRAVGLLLACRGRVVVSGVGKSGHIGRKIAATMASTGTPAMFVHAAEAAHGDLGMITRSDVLVALSYSGETAELLTIVPTLKREGTPLLAITGDSASSAIGAALYSIVIPKDSVLKYETALKTEKFLLIAHGSPAEATKAQHILRTTAVADLGVHGDAPRAVAGKV